jgi:hypothetical protein
MVKATRLRRSGRLSFFLGAVLFAVLFAAIASGDNLQNDAATTAGITTILAGDSTTITYRLIGNSAPSGDVAGCDASVANPVTVTITKPAAVTGPSTLSFTACGSPGQKPATFSSSTAGSYNITHSISGGVTGSLFQNMANFTLTVTAPPPTNTAPSLSLPADKTVEATGPGGASVSYVVSGSDAEDGPLTPSCSPTSGSTFALGITQVNCSVTDSGDLTTSGMFNVTVVDTTDPSLTLPADQTVEATGPSGATVSFSASASDTVDGSVAVNCNPASGDTFPLGVTIVDCSATDAHGNQASGSFNVAVVDTTAPVLTLPDNITKEATGPSGAAATFSASASDIVDENVSVLCDASSGDVFPLGVTTVHCMATDDHSNTASGSFTVTVQDTTAPDLTLPSNITAEATGPSGAAVSFSTSATDLVDGSVAVNCDADSGDTFPLGTTTVSCSATDAHSNTANGSFTVTVQDTTGPSLSLPANISVYSLSASQAIVSYSASANDLVDGNVAISCAPASGSTFSIGTTTVNCSATDAHENTTNGSFTVSVLYNWTGFFQPVDNLPTENVVKAGSAIPVKFSLGGNQGLNILASGYPTSNVVTCGAPAGDDLIESTVTAGSSSLSYDAVANQYVYVWKTDKAWATQCRQLRVKLADGTVVHAANFKFTK